MAKLVVRKSGPLHGEVKISGSKNAVLPILATQGKGDVTYAANLVTIGTLLFVIVVPAVMLLIS